MIRCIWRILFIAACGIISVGCARAEPPAISQMEPSEGYAGQKVKLYGDHLAKTRSVKFYFGQTSRVATFRALSEQELEVTVPENAQRQAEAILVLDHPDGVCVTCPVKETVVRENQQKLSHDQAPGQFTFLHVIRSGALSNVSSTTVIEEGGIVNSVSATCPLVFVKSGGIVGDLHFHSRQAVFCEPGARIRFDESKHARPLQVINVKSIHVAEGIGPFQLQPSPELFDLQEAKAPPTIFSVSPAQVHPGDILTVKGSGFAGVTAVYTVGPVARLSFARIVSDTELRVETPEGMKFGHAELIVINKQGAAVTASRVRSSTAKGSYEFKFLTVTDDRRPDNRDVSTTKVAPLVLVERGGVIFGGNATYLVKEGGTITKGEGMLFHEPGASIPVTRTIDRSDTIEVPTIRMNKIATGFEFVEFLQR